MRYLETHTKIYFSFMRTIMTSFTITAGPWDSSAILYSMDKTIAKVEDAVKTTSFELVYT